MQACGQPANKTKQEKKIWWVQMIHDYSIHLTAEPEIPPKVCQSKFKNSFFLKKKKRFSQRGQSLIQVQPDQSTDAHCPWTDSLQSFTDLILQQHESFIEPRRMRLMSLWDARVKLRERDKHVTSFCKSGRGEGSVEYVPGAWTCTKVTSHKTPGYEKLLNRTMVDMSQIDISRCSCSPGDESQRDDSVRTTTN